MKDVFLEQIVRKRDGAKDIAIKVLIVFVGLLIAFFAFLFVMQPTFGPFALLIAAGALYYAWYFSSGLNLEFEYIYTNGEIDIDKISAKRKRKRMITVKVREFLEFGEYNPENDRNIKRDILIDASINKKSEGVYYATLRNSEGQTVMVLFNPNEKLLGEINALYRKHY